MDTPLIRITGPSQDLEAVYLQHPERTLPHPKGRIPFKKQGVQIMPEQYHVQNIELHQMTKNTLTNPLPFSRNRFIGLPAVTDDQPRQINQPQFLSVNEDIYFQ